MSEVCPSQKKIGRYLQREGFPSGFPIGLETLLGVLPGWGKSRDRLSATELSLDFHYLLLQQLDIARERDMHACVTS